MYSDDPNYRELVAILAEILAQANAVEPPGELWPAPESDLAPMEKHEARTQSPRPEPVPLVVQPCETPQ